MHRRDLLRLCGFGAAGLLASPFTRLLEPAHAGSLGGARRLLVFFTPNGTVHRHWRPESGMQFAPGSILEPLADHADDLLVLETDFVTGNNHEGGMAAMLTGGGGDSIDQVVADAIGGQSRFRSLELGALTSAWGGSSQTRMCYRGGGFVTPNDDPVNAWNRLFGDLGNTALLDRRRSVLDLAMADLTKLRGRLGAEEAARLDLHTEALREVERGLAGGGTCEDPGDLGTIRATDNDAFPDIVKAQIDVAVQALACGMTQVASVQLSHTVGPVVFSWLGESEGHHSLSHIDDGNPTGIASFVNCERWFAAQFAYLLDRLKALPDPETGAPLLDDTTVLWAQELGDGRMHECVNVPWVIAGGGGYFQTGRHLDLDETHDAVLVAVANSLGLPLTRFGVGTSGPAEVLR
ncbi:MAG: DUF1552 domain-containing protein [Deltaproteobacteria bacterium]|nr:MAG: DUF1552 domain-containing protein [Deltaproteobacteria bacterium]